VRKAKILIVEDDPLIAEDLRLTVKEQHYDVTGVATTGFDAIESCQINPPDIVLMDVMLKGELDGIETALLIQEEHSAVGIIFLTAWNELVEKSAHHLVLEKPFHPEKLLQMLKDFGSGEKQKHAKHAVAMKEWR